MDLRRKKADDTMKILIAVLVFLLLLCWMVRGADAACPDSCLLQWTDNSNDEDGFYVYQKINLGAYTKMTLTVPANAKSVTLPALPVAGPSDVTYCCAVSGYNKAGESAQTTDIACYKVAAVVAKPPTAPSGLTVTMETYQALRMSWQNNSTGETGIDVKRGPKVIAQLPPRTTVLLDEGLAEATTYCYQKVVKDKERIGPL
jgi:hypothetical protein